MRDCFSRSFLAKNGPPNARWSSAGPRSRTKITPLQSGSYAQFIGIGREGDRPRIYELDTAMVNRDLENDPGVGVAYRRD